MFFHTTTTGHAHTADVLLFIGLAAFAVSILAALVYKYALFRA